MIAMDRENYTEDDIIDIYCSMPLVDLLKEYNATQHAYDTLCEYEGGYTSIAAEYLFWNRIAAQAIIADRLLVEYGIDSTFADDLGSETE